MTAPDVAATRRWLADLGRPERLATPEMRVLLRAHGRPAPAPALEAGRAAAQLLEDAIETLDPGDGSSRAERLPYRVLRTCFVDGTKNARAATLLGLSERQLSRERTRAVELLAAALAPPHAAGSASPPPLPSPFLARPGVAADLLDALRAHRRVHVCGPCGSGKTVVVAALAVAWRGRTFWHRATRRTGIASLLFELGDHLAPDDPSLAEYVRRSLPRPASDLGTTIALAALGGRERMLVLDGYDGDPEVDAFLDDAVARLPQTAVVTIGRTRRRGAGVTVPPLDRDELAALLALNGLEPRPDVVEELHRWTRGNARIAALVAGWMARATPRGVLHDALRRDSLLLAGFGRGPATGGRSARSRRPSSTACR